MATRSETGRITVSLPIDMVEWLHHLSADTGLPVSKIVYYVLLLQYPCDGDDFQIGVLYENKEQILEGEIALKEAAVERKIYNEVIQEMLENRKKRKG